MATIKLQPSGKVVIKDGKVACECCTAPCGCTFVPKALREIIESATNVNDNGVNISWNGSSAFFEGFDPDGMPLLTSITYEDGVLCAIADNTLNSVKFVSQPLTAEECWFAGAVLQDSSINGQIFRAAAAFPTVFPATEYYLILIFS